MSQSLAGSTQGSPKAESAQAGCRGKLEEAARGGGGAAGQLGKCCVLCFQIDYHYISSQGFPIEGWAVVYYITHL